MSIRNELLQILEECATTAFRALTIQTLNQVHSKASMQYETAFLFTAVPASGTVNIILEIGDEPVILENIQLHFTSEIISATIYKSPDFSGGSEIPVFNLNDDDDIPNDIVIKSGVTLIDPGTQVSPKVTTLGNTNQLPNEMQSTLSINHGVLRVLNKNFVYLFQLINEDTANVTDISAIATWYQGPI